MPVKPKLLGKKLLLDYNIEEVVPYIDWNPFFQVCLQGCMLLRAPCVR
jgi:cobalamin-dependent methionine synthase I